MFLGGGHAGDIPVNAHTRAINAMTNAKDIQYVAYPPPDSPEVSRYTTKCCTQRAWARGDQNVKFLGQVPRLLPLIYIPWAVDLLAQEYVVRWVLQTQDNGTAKIWFDDNEHTMQVQEKNKHMLFDVCGVWVARTKAAVDQLNAYEAALQAGGALDGRLPRHGMTVENLRPPKSVLKREEQEREYLQHSAYHGSSQPYSAGRDDHRAGYPRGGRNSHHFWSDAMPAGMDGTSVEPHQVNSPSSLSVSAQNFVPAQHATRHRAPEPQAALSHPCSYASGRGQRAAHPRGGRNADHSWSSVSHQNTMPPAPPAPAGMDAASAEPVPLPSWQAQRSREQVNTASSLNTHAQPFVPGQNSASSGAPLQPASAYTGFFGQSGSDAQASDYNSPNYDGAAQASNPQDDNFARYFDDRMSGRR